MPKSPNNAHEANAFLIEQVRSGNTDWYRLCLSLARTAWGLEPHFARAIDAWRGAEHRHKFTTVAAIPYGAPLFLRRPGAGPNDAGHVMLAGGYFRHGHGQRIFRSNDIKVHGGVSPTTLGNLCTKWGMAPLGWTEDLNGYDLQLNLE